MRSTGEKRHNYRGLRGRQMRTFNVEQTTYIPTDDEIVDLVFRDEHFLTRDQLIVFTFIAREPLNKSDIFNLAVKFHLQQSAAEKALARLLELELIKPVTVRKLIRHEIRGSMIVDPNTQTLTFVPADGKNKPLIKVQKVPFKTFDLDGGNVINYRAVPAAEKPAHIEQPKEIFHADAKPQQKPNPDSVCHLCQMPFAKSQKVSKVAGKDGNDHPAHQDCIDAFEQRRKLMALVPSQTIQQAKCPLCNKKLGTDPTKRAVVQSKYTLVHTACFDALPHVSGLR